MKQATQLLQKYRGSLAFGHIEIDQGGNFSGKTDIGGEQEDRNMRFGLPHSGSNFASMHPWHGVVQDYGLNRFTGEDFQPGSSVESCQHPVPSALKQDLSNPQADQFVIHAKDKGVLVRHMLLIHSIASTTLS
jgi:hypothetical protein